MFVSFIFYLPRWGFRFKSGLEVFHKISLVVMCWTVTMSAVALSKIHSSARSLFTYRTSFSSGQLIVGHGPMNNVIHELGDALSGSPYYRAIALFRGI